MNTAEQERGLEKSECDLQKLKFIDQLASWQVQSRREETTSLMEFIGDIIRDCWIVSIVGLGILSPTNDQIFKVSTSFTTGLPHHETNKDQYHKKLWPTNSQGITLR